MNNTQKPRFHLIDFVIILAILAGIVVVALRWGIAERLGQRDINDTVEITFVSEGLQKEQALAFSVGDSLYFSEGGAYFGKLISCEVTPYEHYVQMTDGTYQKVTDSEKLTLRCTVSCSGSMDESGFLLSGKTFLAAGSTVQLHNQTSQAEIEILSLRNPQ